LHQGLPIGKTACMKSLCRGWTWVVAGLIAAACSGCATPPHPAKADESAVRQVLEQQIEKWNAGDLAGFMETYAKSDQTHFASGGTLHLGWQRVFDRYRSTYGDAAAMGNTTFSDLEITFLGPDAAVAFGRWHQQGSKGEGSGLFTLILRRFPVGWRIVHDHTSAGTLPK
jgi:beta-aspartyl-peptidase (threonine type)